MRQGVYLDRALYLFDAIGTCQCIDAVNIHRAGPANAFAAGPSEGQGWVDFVFDLDQRVQDHRAAGVNIDKICVYGRVLIVIRVPAINLELLDVGHPFGLGPCLAGGHSRILGERELNHIASPVLVGKRPISFYSGAYRCLI